MSNISDFIIENGELIQYTGPDGNITVPDGVKSFGWGVFRNTRIKTLALPSSFEAYSNPGNVEAIEVAQANPHFSSADGVLYTKSGTILLNVPSLKEGVLSIPKTVTDINYSALIDCPKITEFRVDPESENWQVCDGVLYSKDLKKMIRCPGKKAGILSIPPEVTFMEFSALYDTDEITAFEVSADNHDFSSIDGVLFSKDGTTLLKYPCGKKGEYTVPTATIKIADGAFKNAKGLTKLTITDNVKESERYGMVTGCANLTNIVLPASLYWGRISAGAALKSIDLTGDGHRYFSRDGVVFGRCFNGEIELRDCPCGYSGIYTVPADVDEIANHAFMGCKKLTELHFEGKLPKMAAQEIFLGCSNLRIPSEYLQTDAKLPAVFIHLSQCFSMEDFQWIAVYQTAKGWKETVLEAVRKFDLNAFFGGMLEILQEAKKLPKAIGMNVLDFVLVLSTELQNEQIQRLCEIFEAKKCKAAADAMRADSRLKAALNGDAAPAKKQLCDDPFEQLIRDNWISSKLVEKTQRLIPEGIPYKDSGATCHPDVLAFIAASYAAQLDAAVNYYSIYKSSYVKAVPNLVADRAAEALDPEAFEAFLETLAFDDKNLTAGYLLALGRYASPKCISKLISKMREWESWNYGANGRKAIIIARGGLMLSDTREAMLAVDKVGALDYYAQIRRTTADLLRDTVLSDFGLDQDGKRVCDLGNDHSVEICLNTDLSLSIYDLTAKKTVKSIPKKGADLELHAQVSAVFSDMKKNAKKIAKARCDRLFRAFLDGTEFEVSAWRSVYIGNPLLRQIAGLLVWEQSGVNFTVIGTDTVDCNGESLPLTEAAIKLAHPMEMKADDVRNWQSYFNSRNLKQMFPQIWEPVFDQASVQKERYSGCRIPVLTLSKQTKHGIGVDGLGAYSEDFELHLTDCSVDAEPSEWRYMPGINDDLYYTLGDFSFREYTRWTNHIVGWLDRRVITDKIKCDDVSLGDLLQGFTLAQIMDFIKIATENNCANVLALLLDYKARNFSDFDPMDEFVLEDL